jgi:PKD repeat protein
MGRYTRVEYDTEDSSVSVFCGDLDGDCDLDLAVANHRSDNVSILKNNGDGTFQPKVDYGVGSGPSSVFCVDLDGDTDLDLAVANSWGDNVSILKNNGDGSFQSAVNYVAGDCPNSVFSADLDGDTDLDLAVANSCSDSVSILLNNGDGTFQTKVDYGTGEDPKSVFCADLDGDSDLDLAVANYWSDIASILKNNGDGSFQSAVNYAAGTEPYSVFCADLDGDSDLDLAVANRWDGTVSILENLTQIPGNSPPYPFPLLSPAGGDTLSPEVQFDWATAYDPNLSDQIRYDLLVSTSSEFHPESTTVDSNLVCTHHTDTLTVGTYYWKVRAKDSWGAQTWSTQIWSFVISGLLANFGGDSTSGCIPLEVQFTDLSVGNPTSWFWDFGDDSTSTEQHPTHTYTDTGYFDVKLVVSNPQGTDSLTKEDYIHVLPSIPVLLWSDKIGYLTDGVSPDTGLTGTLFTFRVVYSDAYNLPPQSGYPKVNLDLNGDGDFEDENEGSFTMGVVDVDTNYVDGREYLYNATLPTSSNCQYSFSAKNTYGLDAIGEPTNRKAGPVILDPDSALDLYIHASDIVFSDPNPDEGDTFTVYATVHNNSDSNVTNVSVSFYHSGDTLDQVFIPNISPHSSATTFIPLSFDYEGFYPIKVAVDEENAFEEWNELNNFAIRPIIVGDYDPPGGIVVQAQLNSPVYPYSWITVMGNAHYTPEHLGVVSGATVTIIIQETGYDTTVYTNDPGDFSVGFYGPSQAGDYSVKVEVTDYTLTGDTTLDLEVISEPGVDLAIRIDLSDCLSENQEDTVRTEIFNLGDQDAQNFWTCVYKDASPYHCYWVDQLLAGDSLEIDTVISFSSTGWHTVTGIVDVGDSVSEYNEGNNVHTISRYVRCNGPDITIINVVFSDYTPKGEQPIDITAWVVNLGGVAVSESFGVEFSDNGVPFDTQYVTSLAPCEMETAYVVSDSFVYSDTIPHSFSIFADFENAITECGEENNVWGGGPCIDLKIAYHDIGFSDTDPQSDTVRIMAKVFNLGDISAFDSKVRFEIDGVQIGQHITVNTIHPDSFEAVFSSDTWQVDLSACSLLVEVDPEDLIGECDESNNVAYCPLPYDLYPYYRSSCRGNYPYVFSVCHPTVNDSLTIFGVVRNRGGFDITGQVQIEVTDDIEGLLGIITVDSVLNHESNIALGSLRQAFTQYGWHIVTLHADYDSQYYECGREDNNYYSASIFVDSLRPDLEVRSEYIEFSEPCPTWGDSLWFFVTTYNIGQNVAENVRIRFLVDEAQVGEDILIDSIPVGSNNYHTDSSTAPWIVPEEFDITHICKIVLDPDNEILEESEDNNEATRALPVVRCGDVNQDCIVNIADVVYLITYLFIEGPPPFPCPAADVNTDGKVDIADVVYLINYLFLDGPPPGCK